MLRFDRRRRSCAIHDITGDPAIEELLAFPSRHEAADLVAHHRFQIMREARDGKNILELRRKTSVCVRRIRIVLLRLIGGLRPKKCGIVGALTVDERNKAVISEFLLPAICNSNLCGTF